MKVVHVIPSIAEEASGPSYSVPRLCDELASSGCEVQLHDIQGLPRSTGFKTIVHEPLGFLPHLGISPRLHQALKNLSKSVDVIHNHSLWMFPNVYPGWVAGKSRAKLVTSPRGTLSPYALNRNKWAKKLFWAMGQHRSMTLASCVHATSIEEASDVRTTGYRGPIAVVPNGIDIPPIETSFSLRRRQILFLGRIHPIKNVELLIRSWVRLEPRFSDWELVFVGPEDSDYADRMKQLSRELSAQRIIWSGPAYGQHKRDHFLKASVFVLPSHSENFGVAVAEALAHGVPVIASQNTPWQGVEDRRCGWWVDTSRIDSLSDALETALSTSTTRLQAMGNRGRDWMLEEFDWACVAKKMKETYEWILAGGQVPNWVDLG